jgi:hypothetical protein
VSSVSGAALAAAVDADADERPEASPSNGAPDWTGSWPTLATVG